MAPLWLIIAALVKFKQLKLTWNIQVDVLRTLLKVIKENYILQLCRKIIQALASCFGLKPTSMIYYYYYELINYFKIYFLQRFCSKQSDTLTRRATLK